MKLGFALGSGGSRGVAHIGFLQAMEEIGVKPDFISGSSMGSVVGACYAAGMSVEEMKNAVFELKALDILDLSGNALRNQALFKSKKMRAQLDLYLGEKTFEDLKIPFSCVAVDLISGSPVTFTEGSVVDAVLASSSMPTVCRPVEQDGMLLVDGGVLCRVPVRQVKDLGADAVVAVDVLGKVRPVEKVPNVISLIMRTYDVMDAAKTATQKRSARKYCDLWLEPDMGDISQYRIRFDQSVYDAGYYCGMNNAEKIKNLLEN